MRYHVELIVAMLAVLALLAQLRLRAIAPPPPIAARARVDVAVADGGDAVEVTFRGTPGLVLSFHNARWNCDVLAVTGPLSLIGRRDLRRFTLAPPPPGTLLTVRCVWEQLTMREVTLTVPAATRDTLPTVEPPGRRPRVSSGPRI